jgi:hypothetical protein
MNADGGVSMLDKQGKLFGKINIIDLAVLLAVLLLVAGFLYREKSSSVIINPKTVQMQVVCPFVYPNVVDNVKVGDQLVANGAPVPVYITSVKVTPAQTTVSKPDGSMILTTNPFRKDIFLTIEGKTSAITPGEITLGGQKVRAGVDNYYVKTQKLQLTATILKVEVK